MICHRINLSKNCQPSRGVEGSKPKRARWLQFGCNWRPFFETKNWLNQFGVNDLKVGDISPEKAGVGGSIPSLATMFSIVYRPSQNGSCARRAADSTQLLVQFSLWSLRSPMIGRVRAKTNGRTPDDPQGRAYPIPILVV